MDSGFAFSFKGNEAPMAVNLKPFILLAWLMAMATSMWGSVGFAGENTKAARLGSPDDDSAKGIERLIVQKTNAYRVAKGLKPLSVSPALNYLALEQTKHTCELKKLEHESDKFPRGWRAFEERLRMVKVNDGGENLARRTAGSAEKWATAVVNGWMESPPHRKNIVSDRFRYIGVGIVTCSDRLIYATQVFSSEPGQTPKR
jgi:uncharacterized protein YkwD